MAGDAARIAEVRAWLSKAAADIRAAEHVMTADLPLRGDAVFHCQQAVEKTLNPLLSWHDRPLRKTRDPVEIGAQCVELDGSLEAMLRRAAPLTEYAWKFRYPGEAEEPALDEAGAALDTARDACQAILERLPAEVRPNP